MSWMQQLCQVYDNNIDHVGKFETRRQQRITLLPVSHIMQSAQIEVLISPEGNFINAKVIDKDEARTIIPVTTSSANRSNQCAPHYLHDKLQYVAGDYIKYGGESKYKDYFNQYYNQMKEWADSDGCPDKVKAIFTYIAKRRLIEDLVEANILPIDSDNKVINKWASNEDKPHIYQVVPDGALNAFVRFDVLHQTPNDPFVWEDTSLFDAFIKFLKRKENDFGYCYITGLQTSLTTQHGSKIRNAGDRSKLISANDKTGFTFRGRFSQPTDAVLIGYEVSQKSHHALRWLIQRQGTNIDSRYFIAFGIETSDIPQPFNSTSDIIGIDIFTQSLQNFAKNQIYTEEIVAEELHKALHGIKHHLDQNNLKNIIIMALDAATTGRLAIVYYQHLHAEFYFDAIKHWHQTCRWLQTHKDADSKTIINYVGTPSTHRIIEAVYGKKADSQIKKELYTRLLPCIVDKKPIPKDIVFRIFNRIKNPHSFSDSDEWNHSLNIACALINKLYESEGFSLALQEDNLSRDYLFGRLLGVAEVMERRILKERNDNRATNATRYFNAFSQHPARTWLIIRKQLTPFFERSGQVANYYAMLLQKIEDKLSDEQMNNKPLSPLFLLGYSSQIQDLYTKKEDTVNDHTK